MTAPSRRPASHLARTESHTEHQAGLADSRTSACDRTGTRGATATILPLAMRK